MKKIKATVVSYDSINNIATVNLPNDSTNIEIYNLSGQTITINDTVIIFYESDISKGYIFADINNRSTASGSSGSYTDEQAQDAVGNILANSSNINFTYNDALPSITADLSNVTTTSNTSSASPSDGTSFTAIDSITTDGYGRVTAKNTKTVTLPSILSKALTGLSTATNAVISATDSILIALGKLQAQITDRVIKNTTITGATKTKITYDSKGLVTSGVDATTADIADSTDRRYITDAQRTIIQNTSGTNSGDETSSTIKSKLGVTTLSGSNTGDITVLDTASIDLVLTGQALAANAIFGTTSGTVCQGNDIRLSDARTPTTHNQADTTITFSDVTTGNVSTSMHGYCPKLVGGTVNFLRADGTWATPPAATGGAQIASGSYTGTGTFGSNISIVLGFVPKVVFITVAQPSSFTDTNGRLNSSYQIFVNPQSRLLIGSTGSDYTYLTWGSTFQWYNTLSAAFQMNASGITYYYVAIG